MKAFLVLFFVLCFAVDSYSQKLDPEFVQEMNWLKNNGHLDWSKYKSVAEWDAYAARAAAQGGAGRAAGAGDAIASSVGRTLIHDLADVGSGIILFFMAKSTVESLMYTDNDGVFKRYKEPPAAWVPGQGHGLFDADPFPEFREQAEQEYLSRSGNRSYTHETSTPSNSGRRILTAEQHERNLALKESLNRTRRY